MAAKQLMLPANRAFNSNGLAVPGAVAKLYATGTLTPAIFYADSGLLTSLGSSIVANAAGRFDAAYQDEATPFRLIVETPLGVELDDIDPYYFGSTYGSVISTANTNVTSRTLMAALTGVAGATVTLSEAGREGIFVFDASNLSAQVTADTAQGIYVAPATDTTGASGAWVRQFSGPININWFGAVPDCTAIGTGTNNATAINAAIAVSALDNKSAEILVPGNILGYRVSSTITFTTGVKLRGQGFHENPGQVGATVYTPPQNWRGSILVFDQNIAGLQFIDFTDNLANATALEYEGARFSVVEDIALYGGAGTTVTAHGVETRTVLEMRNVRIENFGGHGLYINATTAGAVLYGNASNSKFDHVKVRGNKCHGVKVTGSDANTMTFIALDSALNGGAGYFDNSTVGGNTLLVPHFATNNQSNGAGTSATTAVQADSALLSTAANGSIIIDNGAQTPHVIVAAYIEVGVGRLAHIPAGTLILGGILGQVGSAMLEATSAPTLLDAAGTLQAPSLVLTATGDNTIKHGSGANVDIINSAGGTAGLRMRPGSGTFSHLQMMGNTDLVANGLDILAGSAAAYFSADSHTFRNAAQTVISFTADGNGINLDTGNRLAVGGTQVVGTQGAALADHAAITAYTPHASGAVAVTSAAATDLDTTAAALSTLRGEVASLRTTVNTLLARTRAHGLIAT